MHAVTTFAILLILVFSVPEIRAARRAAATDGRVEIGALDEIRNMRGAMLVANRSYVVDARDAERGSLDLVYSSITDRRLLHLPSYLTLARDLNKYVKRHGSLTSVKSPGEADFFIIFRVVEERRTWTSGEYVVLGQLFIITKETEQRPNPRLVWRSEKELTRPDEAIRAFIKDLKRLRGER